MSKIQSTIWKIYPHTQAKHEILRRYLNVWLSILTKPQGRVVIIDGFAGPGEYIGDVEGSPIIEINAVMDRKIQINSEVVFLFIEKDKDRCEFLKNKLGKLRIPKNIKYTCRCDDFVSSVNGLLDSLDDGKFKLAPTFVFIDPFGFKDIPFDLIRRLLKNDKCEVLITFMYEEINRFVNEPGLELTYDSLFGTKSWREVLKKKDPKERLEILHNTYRDQLNAIAKYVRSFEMKNAFGKTDYFLFFATNHILGMKKMKEAIWKVDPRGGFSFSDATYDPNQTVLIEPKPNYTILKRRILEEYRGKRVKVEDLEEFIVAKTMFRESHYKTNILKIMEQTGEIKTHGDRRKKFTYPPDLIIEFLDSLN